MDQPQPQLTGTLTTELGEAHVAMRSGRLEYQPGGWGRAEAMKLAVDTGGRQDPGRHVRTAGLWRESPGEPLPPGSKDRGSRITL